MKWNLQDRSELKLFAAAAGFAFFLTHGLPLADDDYRVWLTQANSGVLDLLWRTLSPVSADYPLQGLAYRILSLLFGTWGTAYYLLKSLIFGAFCIFLSRRIEAAKIGDHARLAALSLFILSANSALSLIWHADFTLYAQFMIAPFLGWAVDRLKDVPYTGLGLYADAFRNKLRGVPRDFVRLSAAVWAVTYFGSKFSADFRLIPIVLMVYLSIYKRDRATLYAIPFTLTFLMALPWTAPTFTQLPPIAPWFTRLADFAGAFGLAGFFALVAFVALRGQSHGKKGEIGLIMIWLGADLAMAAIGREETGVAALSPRHTFAALVPATLLLASFFEVLFRAIAEFPRARLLRFAALTLVALQAAHSLFAVVQARREVGRLRVALDRAYDWVELFHPTESLVTLPGFPAFGHVESLSHALTRVRALGSSDEISQLTPGKTYALSWAPTLDARFVLEKIVSGCGTSLFDLAFRCRLTEGVALLHYQGNVSDVIQADQFDRQGNLIAARDTLESYVRREPGNHGAAFILSLYNHRLGDYTRMEQTYEALGPYFPNHASVLYNWGLAKQQRQKYTEASELFERAYALAPKDYGVGYHLADAYYRQGKKGRALATLGDLMRRYPDDPEVQAIWGDWKSGTRAPASN